MSAWLKADPENIVAVHCKAGKGRTGLMIAAFLVYSGACSTTTDALRLFGDERTHNGKGVTIPSQMRLVHRNNPDSLWRLREPYLGQATAHFIDSLCPYFLPFRYVHYLEVSLKREITPQTYRLRHLRLHTVPNFDVGGGCDPYFDIRLGDGKQMMFDWKKVGLQAFVMCSLCRVPLLPSLRLGKQGKGQKLPTETQNHRYELVGFQCSSKRRREVRLL